jgi:hypothetical protein
MIKANKLIVTVMLVALVMQFVPMPSAFATTEGKEVMFKTQVDAGHWDIWLHADGTTWQYTGKPGNVKSYDFEIVFPDQADKYDNVRYEMVAGITREQFMAASGWWNFKPNEEGWDELDREILKYIPDNYRKTGDNQVTFTLSPKTRAKLLKESDQEELVEGWRWYLPITVSWYGAPKEQAPPDPEVKGGRNIGYFMDYPVQVGNNLQTTVVRWTSTGETRRYVAVHVNYPSYEAWSAGTRYFYEHNYQVVPGDTVLFDVTWDHSKEPLFVKNVSYPMPEGKQISVIYILSPNCSVNQHYALSGFMGTHTLKADLPEDMHVDEGRIPDSYKIGNEGAS